MVFVSFGSYLVKPQVASADLCSGLTLKATYTYSSNTYNFTAKTTGNYNYDETSLFNYQWSINTQPTATILSSQAASFSDPLSNISPNAYAVTVTGTPTQASQTGLIHAPSCNVNATFNLTVANGATSGYVAQISQLTQTQATPDSNNNYPWRLIAELDNASNNNTVISGGLNSVGGSTGNGYNWSWAEKSINADGTTGNLTPVLDSSGNAVSGYNVLASFPAGSYYVIATATPSSSSGGSPIKTNPTFGSTVNAGRTATCNLNLTQTRNGSSGFSYQFNAPITCASIDYSINYTYTWTVNNTKLSANGYNVPATLQAGTNTINVSALNNQDHTSTISNNVTLTLDASGNLLTTNGNGSTSDACSLVGTSGVTCIVGRVIGSVLGFIVQIVSYLTSQILLPITIAIIGIQVHTAAFSAVIIQEWVFIRNFCNIFFIATLIIVGMGTLLQMSSYNLKQVLPRFIIAALLVNFSLAISQAILGVADAFQAQFLGIGGGQSTVILDNLAYRLMVAPLAHITTSNAAALAGVASAVVTEFIYFLIAIVAVFVFVALTAYLLIRVVALWLLLMSSPIAYAASVVPIKTIQGWASTWWNNFFKYAFFTPIIALLLHICALLANAQSSFTAAGVSVAAQVASGVTGTQLAVTDILTAMLVAACMGAALSVAKSMSIKGADKVMAGFDSVQGKIFGSPKVVGQYALDRANRARRNIGQYMSTDSQGNPRGGRFNIGRLGNLALNPDAAFKTMSANFDEKNKTAAELANARAERFSGLNQTGVDKKNDISLRQKKRDEKTSQFMNFDRDTLKTMQGQATDNETRMQILAARARLGFLKRDAQDQFSPETDADGNVKAHELTDDEFRDYSLNAIRNVPVGQQKAFLQQTFDKLGEEKKDLSLVGWSEFQSGGATAQTAAQIEKLKSWGPDDMSKVKPGTLKSNNELQTQFSTQVANYGQEVADGLNSKTLAAMVGIDDDKNSKFRGQGNLAKILSIQSNSKATQIAAKTLDDLKRDNPLAHSSAMEALVAKAENALPADVADKLSSQQMKGMTDAQLARVAAKMSSSAISKLDPSVLDFDNKSATQDAIINAAIRNHKVVQDMPQVLKDSFKGDKRAALIGVMGPDDVAKLDASYVQGNASATKAMVNTLLSNKESVNKVGWKMLETVTDVADRNSLLAAMNSAKIQGIPADYITDQSHIDTVAQKIESDPNLITKINNDVLRKVKSAVKNADTRTKIEKKAGQPNSPDNTNDYYGA